MYILFAFLIGTLITLMVMFNSVLSVEAGHLLSILVIHLVGLSTVSFFLLFKKKRINTEKIPVYLYFAGIIGVLIVFSNNLCFSVLGASVTISLGILGQSIGSIFIDSTGFLGMKKHLFDTRKITGFIIIMAGVLLMVDKWEFQLLYITIAFFAGMFVILTMVLNSLLGLRLGVFQATRVNYIVGLITAITIIIISGFEFNGSFEILKGIHLIYLLGGGIFGVFIVASINYVVPKIPTIYTTILMFLGQIVTGLMIDYFMYHVFSVRMLVGAGMVLAGLLVNIWIDTYQNFAKRKKIYVRNLNGIKINY